jgi:F-type H+-transporting ATPase subunit b
MPQLNFADFPPQLIWLAITFVVLYLLMSRVALPRVASVLERRQAHIATDLEKAEKRRAEAEEALAAYRQTLDAARSDAQSAVRTAADEMARQQAARDAEFAASLAKRTREAEASIAAARDKAQDEMRLVAGDIAAAIAAKLAEVTFPADRVAAAVDAARQERA